MATGARRGGTTRFLLLAVLPLLGGCSLRSLAISGLADALESSAAVYASDDDPELVRAALPFALKTIEGLLLEAPDDRRLLLAACRGFTQYAYAFADTDAEAALVDDFLAAERLRERALGLYLRARDYCLRGLAGDLVGGRATLVRDPAAALAGVDRDDVPLLYWTGASWGAAIAAGLDRPELVVDLPVVRALLERALELDEDWGDGALHAAMMPLEAAPASLGGSPEALRHHYERAVALSEGASAGPHVAWAEAMVRRQDRAEFLRALAAARAVDVDARPAERLANLVAQRRAELLAARTDELFLDGDLDSEPAIEEDE